MASRMMRLSEAEYDKMTARQGVAGRRKGTKAESAAPGDPSVHRNSAAKPEIAIPGKQVSDKPNKYRAHRTVGGYASKKEGQYAHDLRLREKAGQVRNIREQVKFLLIPAQEGERPCSYWCDFCFDELQEDGSWLERFVDVKGYKDGGAYALFVVKRKLMKSVYGISITEV